MNLSLDCDGVNVSTYTCCDEDGSCTDGDDDYCCNGVYYCSTDGAAYAGNSGGILCPWTTSNTPNFLLLQCSWQKKYSQVKQYICMLLQNVPFVLKTIEWKVIRNAT